MLAASGFVLGLATLTKIPAVLALAVIAAVYLLNHRKGDRQTLLRHMLWFGLPFLVVVTPWFIKFYSHYGMLMPDWLQPDAEMIERSPYVQMIMGRPPYFYFKQIFLLYPWLIFSLWQSVAAWRRRDRDYALAWAFLLWLACVFAGLAIMGGHSQQMRLIAMAVTPLYMLATLTLRDLINTRGPMLMFVALAGITGAGTAVWHAHFHTLTVLHDLISILEY